MLKRNILSNSIGGDGGTGAGGGHATSGTAGGGADGSSGAGANGGGGFLPGSGSGASGAGANTQSQPAGTANSNQSAASVQFPENWKLGLPIELQEDPSLKVVHDIPALAKSYINAQKLVGGADKIVIPSKHATEEDWQVVYHKLGLPKDSKDYVVKASEDSGIRPEFMQEFSQQAHKAGILPQSAQKLVDWFSTANKQAAIDMQKQQDLALERDITGLRSEWGDAFDKELNKANFALKHFADPQTIAYLEDTGLTKSVPLIKLFNKVAAALGEDKIASEAGSGGGALTPSQAMEEYTRILKDMSHPYYNANHPNHRDAVQEASKLFEMASKKRS